MMGIPVWIDCDTGVDDAAALITAHYLAGLGELDIVGLSTVAGNVDVQKTTANTLKVCGLLGHHYPVYKGASKPLMHDYDEGAVSVHGVSGLGQAVLPDPDWGIEAAPAWDGMLEAARVHPGELTIISVGPLTNLATALAIHPELRDLVKQIAIMGGAVEGGNVTPAAEFNIYEDAEAAQAVFLSGIPMIMCGLDVTMKAYLTFEEIDELNAGGSRGGRFFWEATRDGIAFMRSVGQEFDALHDSCPVLFVARPELFEAAPAGVFVETQGSVTYGKTVSDLLSDTKFDDRHVTVVTGVDREAFKQVTTEALLSV